MSDEQKTPEPNDNAEELASLALEAEGMAEEAPRPVDAPGQQDEVQDIPTEALLMGVMNPAFAILAPNWNIQPKEVELLAESYACVIDKYFPGGVGAIGPELAAATATFAIFLPRMHVPRKSLPVQPTPPAEPEEKPKPGLFKRGGLKETTRGDDNA